MSRPPALQTVEAGAADGLKKTACGIAPGYRRFSGRVLALTCTKHTSEGPGGLMATSIPTHPSPASSSNVQPLQDFEVVIADPAVLNGRVEHLRPHVLVRDDDGTEVGSPEGVVCWVGTVIDNHLKARISMDGKVSDLHEVSIDELLAALDEAAKFVSAGEGPG